MTIHSLVILLSQFGMSIVPCPVVTVILDLHTSFSRGRLGGLVVPSLEEFSIVCCDLHSQRLSLANEAEAGGFQEFFCFLYDPTDVGNLISGSSAISKSSL